jgi:hypothetical protein
MRRDNGPRRNLSPPRRGRYRPRHQTTINTTNATAKQNAAANASGWPKVLNRRSRGFADFLSTRLLERVPIASSRLLSSCDPPTKVLNPPLPCDRPSARRYWIEPDHGYAVSARSGGCRRCDCVTLPRRRPQNSASPGRFFIFKPGPGIHGMIPAAGPFAGLLRPVLCAATIVAARQRIMRKCQSGGSVDTRRTCNQR